MIILQRDFDITVKSRGFHIITEAVIEHVPEIENVICGIVHVFIKHTSASLIINERADPAVRDDLESHFERTVPDDAPYYKHTFEGPGDMACHVKSSLLGTSVSVPVAEGKLNLGKWQGIILCEHRTDPPVRHLAVVLIGTAKVPPYSIDVGTD